MRSLLLLLLLVATTSAAMDAPPSLDAAREAYERGDFRAAIDGYRAALDAGADHALVHYNLGNAHFKAGDLGEAIASYVRAQRRAPRDERIRTNLAVARAQIRDRDLAGDLPAVLVPLAWIYHGLSLDEWWTLFAVCFFVGVLGLVLGHWVVGRRPLGRRVALAAAVVGVLALGMGLTRYRVEVATASAVVVREEIEVRSGPGSDYNLAFRVHEGLQVEVAERRGEWWRIDLGGELVGWVPSAALESL